MTEIVLEPGRTPPETLRYLAARLGEGADPQAVALVLTTLAATLEEDARHVREVALAAAGPVAAEVERERIRKRSIERIAAYVLARRDGEAVGVTEFINDLMGEPDAA